jgi:ABC-type lipoprotein release transport system permease subunit
VSIIGVDPASEGNQPCRDGLVSGDFPAADDRAGILVGQALADKLKVTTGDNLYMMVNTSSGDVAEQEFTIRGLYNTNTPTFDEATVLMPLDKAQGITGAGNHASSVFVLLNDRDQAEALKASMPAGYQVKTWKEMNTLVLEMESLSSGYMFLLYLIILGVAVTVIVNTLIMAVFERTREIGILAAIGMKGRRIMAMFFAESSLLALGGIVIGLALGWLTCFLVELGGGIHIPNVGASGLALGNVIHTNITLKDAINLSIFALVISLLASLYPARLAANMEPVEALHGGK